MAHKYTLSMALLLATSLMVSSQTVILDEANFPDPEFRSYLSERFDITEGSEFNAAQKIPNPLRMSDYPVEAYPQVGKIKSVKGVELFTNVTHLTINQFSALTELDLTAMPQLVALDCAMNQSLESVRLKSDNLIWFQGYTCALAQLDLSEIPNLTYLSVKGNKIQQIDLSPVGKLTNLLIDSNGLEEIDLSYVPMLEELSCANNHIADLDLSPVAKLTTLVCANNLLKDLDLTHTPDLTDLRCHHNQIASLNLRPFPGLTRLQCSHNSLVDLDLSANTQLIELSCDTQTRLVGPCETWTFPATFDRAMASRPEFGEFTTDLAGDAAFRFDVNSMKGVYQYDPAASGAIESTLMDVTLIREPVSTGVENVASDGGSAARYYDLNGVDTNKLIPGRFYVKVTAEGAEKFLAR